MDLAHGIGLPIRPTHHALRQCRDRISQRRPERQRHGLADVVGGAFQPEDTLMYELGIKSEYLDHRLRINADYFYGKYDHLQEAVVLEDGTVTSANNTAHVNGLELGIEALPVTGLRL